MMMTTFAEGQLVRVLGRPGVFRLKRIRLVNGESEVWGPGDNPRMHTVDSTLLGPPQCDDIGPPEPACIS